MSLLSAGLCYCTIRYTKFAARPPNGSALGRATDNEFISGSWHVMIALAFQASLCVRFNYPICKQQAISRANVYFEMWIHGQSLKTS